MTRMPIYLAANCAFVLLVVAGAGFGDASAASPVYLTALFALCSTPLLTLRRANDNQALLALFASMYFIFFGWMDLIRLLTPPEGGIRMSGLEAHVVPNASECVILVGLVCVLLCYRLVNRGRAAARTGFFDRDWNESTLAGTGLVLWAVSTALSWHFRVHLVADTSVESTATALGNTSSLMVSVYMLANMVQPLGILIIAYAQTRYRRGYLTALVVAVVCVQLVFGFVIDVKGDALAGVVIVILTKLLVNGRVPRAWLAAAVVFIALAFPVLQANRVVLRGEDQASNAQVAQNIGAAISRAFEARERVTMGQSRSQNFFERLSLKPSVELIVENTGERVVYQNGYTLVPLLGVFIPRLIWPSKPDVATGRLMNKEFAVTEQEATYISPSHLGEFYWNFGWAGVIVGMSAVGLLLGGAARFWQLGNGPTVAKLMLLVATVKLLIFGFESSVAAIYSLWFRSILAIAVLQLLFALRARHQSVAAQVNWA